MAYERDNIARLSGYVPGEQPHTEDVIKLNTNENPYPPPDAVMEAVRKVAPEALRRYPPPRAEKLREAAARAHGLGSDQVIATNGGDELLRLAITCFCRPRAERSAGEAPPPEGGGLGLAEPGYSLDPVLAAIHDTPGVRVERAEDFSLPPTFTDRVIEADCRLVMIVNPHAPSGRLEPIERLEEIARALKGRAVLLIDEAYVDFAGSDALALLESARGLDNVLLLRSFSKGYSLAGLRLGYGLAHGDLIRTLDKVRDSYNVDRLAQAAGIAALHHRDQAREHWSKVVAERARLGTALEQRGWRVYPSQTNFLLAVPPPEGPGAGAIEQHLKQQQVYVRHFDQPRLRDKLRITVGTPGQTDALLAALDQGTPVGQDPSARQAPA